VADSSKQPSSRPVEMDARARPLASAAAILFWCSLPLPAFADAASTARAVGSAIGMALFGYFVMRALNRRKDSKAARATRLAVPVVLLCLFGLLYASAFSGKAETIRVWKKNYVYDCIMRRDLVTQFSRSDHRIAVCECHADRIASASTVAQLGEFHRDGFYRYAQREDIRALVASCRP
jgi:hypothetical protein